MSGFVSLVGAGPGDPELLTVKAVDRLQRADVVLYDALLAPEVLGHATRAHRFFVGKRAGRAAVKQETINALLVRAARRGRRVVRLKCGDSYVFGRGGEEALALSEAGVPFEIVPGVSSALSAPALAGVPVTHRGLASGFVVVSGHAPAAYAPILGALAPQTATVVVLMGLAARAEIARFLLARGWAAETPALIAFAASHAKNERWLGTLAGLAEAPLPSDDLRDAPATITVGAVVGLATRLAPRLAPEARDAANASPPHAPFYDTSSPAPSRALGE